MAFLSIQCIVEEGNHIFVPLEQLQSIYSEIDIPSEFKEIDSHNNTRQQDSLTSRFYKSSLTYPEVKKYFNASCLVKIGFMLTK